jgi:hypothetical protein
MLINLKFEKSEIKNLFNLIFNTNFRLSGCGKIL